MTEQSFGELIGNHSHECGVKKPQAGEWWGLKSVKPYLRIAGKPYLCIDSNARGETVWRSNTGAFYVFSDDSHWKHWQHEPLCDGFDWQPKPAEPSDVDAIAALEGNRAWGPHYNARLTEQIKAVIAIAKRAIQPPSEVWPKWYVTKQNNDGYYVCYSETDVWHRDQVGNTAKQYARASVLMDDKYWTDVSEAEALARVKPLTNVLSNCPECGEFRGHGHECVTYQSLQGTPVATIKITPVESPDDWVTQDRVPARPEIDQRRYTTTRGKTPWADAGCLDWDRLEEATHGREINGTTLELRCRRKDLPPMPQQYGEQPVVNRVPVRLWADDTDDYILWRSERPWPGCREVTPDGNGGWCIEVPQ